MNTASLRIRAQRRRDVAANGGDSGPYWENRNSAWFGLGPMPSFTAIDTPLGGGP